jgi:hypothetical protein
MVVALEMQGGGVLILRERPTFWGNKPGRKNWKY